MAHSFCASGCQHLAETALKSTRNETTLNKRIQWSDLSAYFWKFMVHTLCWARIFMDFTARFVGDYSSSYPITIKLWMTHFNSLICHRVIWRNWHYHTQSLCCENSYYKLKQLNSVWDWWFSPCIPRWTWSHLFVKCHYAVMKIAS